MFDLAVIVFVTNFYVHYGNGNGNGDGDGEKEEEDGGRLCVNVSFTSSPVNGKECDYDDHKEERAK